MGDKSMYERDTRPTMKTDRFFLRISEVSTGTPGDETFLQQPEVDAASSVGRDSNFVLLVLELSALR